MCLSLRIPPESPNVPSTLETSPKMFVCPGKHFLLSEIMKMSFQKGKG